MAIKAGSRMTVEVTVIDSDTFEPIVGATVELAQYSPAVGTYVPVQTLRSEAGGVARGVLQLPNEPGTYRYRGQWSGTPDIRGDTSPETRITVV